MEPQNSNTPEVTPNPSIIPGAVPVVPAANEAMPNPFSTPVPVGGQVVPTPQEVIVTHVAAPAGAGQLNPTEVVTTPAPSIAAVTADIQAKAAGTEAMTDYAKYAAMAETPAVTERRTFDFVSVSGAVVTETLEDGVTERRKPATAYKINLTKPKGLDGNFVTEQLALPLSIIPIKYRVVMEQRAGNKGEILVLKSTEFNGKMSEKVVISRFTPDGKVAEKYGPMTVSEARNMFKSPEGKGVLREKAHVYALHNGEVVRFVVKGAGLWEDRSSLVNGKTEASKTPYQFITEYLQTFPMTEPYFLYEMKVDAAYRDHIAVKFYRPTFGKGARISGDVEVEVLKNLEDLHKYFLETDEATAKFVADKPAATGTVVVDAPTSADTPF